MVGLGQRIFEHQSKSLTLTNIPKNYNSGPEFGGVVVYTSQGSEFERVAREIADHRNERLVHDTRDIPNGEPIVYVEDISEIDESMLVRFQRAQLRSSHTPFSVVTGYTPSDALELYYRDLPDDGIHSLAFLYPEDHESSDPDCEIIYDDEVTSTKLRQQDGKGLASFTIHTHAWPIHLNLSEGLICGFPQDVSFEDYSGPQPFCVRDGRKQCPYDADLIPAQDFQPSHVFLISCGSVIGNGFSGMPVHVSAGLLTNVESLIGVYRMSYSCSFEAFLNYALLKGGYGVSERVYLLNKNAHVNNINYCPYIPIGRPSAGLTPPDRCEYDYSVNLQQQNRVEIANVDSPVIDISLPSSDLPAPDDRYYVKLLDEVDEDVYYLIFGEGDEQRLIVYSTERLKYDKLRFEISSSSVCFDRVKQANRMLENGERHAALGILNDTAMTQLRTLREQTRRFPKAVDSHNYDAQTYTKTEKRTGELLGNANAIHDELLSDIKNEAKYLNHKYAHRAIDYSVDHSEQMCIDCDRGLFLKYVSNGRNVERTTGTCPKCGMVFDIPHLDGNLDGRPIVLSDQMVGEDETVTITIRFSNPKNHTAKTTVCPVIRRRGCETEEGSSIFRPEHKDVTVAPGETVDLEFDFETGVVPNNQYIILGYVISNLELYMGCSTTIVGDKAGFYEPRHDS